MKKTTESELFEQIKAALEDLCPVEFVEEVNRALGTDYTINDIDWDEHDKDYERQ